MQWQTAGKRDSLAGLWPLDNGQQWRRTIDGSHLWNTASSGGSVVVNLDMRDLERSPVVGEWGEVSPRFPWCSPCTGCCYCLTTALPLFMVTTAARMALQREERSRQGKGWVKKEEEMTRQSQEKPGAAGKHGSCNVQGRWKGGGKPAS